MRKFKRLKAIPDKNLLLYAQGPLLTVALLLLNFTLFPISLAPAFLVVVWSTYTGGRGPGLVTAALVSGFALYQWAEINPARATIATICVILVVWLVSELKRQTEAAHELERQAAMLGSLDENIKRLVRAIRRLDDLINGWNVLTDKARIAIITEINSDLATLATLVMGWHRLYEEKKAVKRDEP